MQVNGNKGRNDVGNFEKFVIKVGHRDLLNWKINVENVRRRRSVRNLKTASHKP